MNQAWATEITARARAHWTAARVEELTRGKALALMPIEAAPLLRALGLFNSDGSLPPARALQEVPFLRGRDRRLDVFGSGSRHEERSLRFNVQGSSVRGPRSEV